MRWRFRRRDFQVSIRGSSWKLDHATLLTGATLILPDESSLFIQRDRRRWWSVGMRDELRVERDGIPLPGSDGDPRVIARRAAGVILLFGLLRVGFAGLWLTFSRDAVAGRLYLAMVDGALLFVLGILTAFGHRLPIALAAGVLGLEMLGTFASGAVPSPVAFVIQVLVIVHLVRS